MLIQIICVMSFLPHFTSPEATFVNSLDEEEYFLPDPLIYSLDDRNIATRKRKHSHFLEVADAKVNSKPFQYSATLPLPADNNIIQKAFTKSDTSTSLQSLPVLPSQFIQFNNVYSFTGSNNDEISNSVARSEHFSDNFPHSSAISEQQKKTNLIEKFEENTDQLLVSSFDEDEDNKNESPKTNEFLKCFETSSNSLCNSSADFSSPGDVIDLTASSDLYEEDQDEEEENQPTTSQDSVDNNYFSNPNYPEYSSPDLTDKIYTTIGSHVDSLGHSIDEKAGASSQSPVIRHIFAPYHQPTVENCCNNERFYPVNQETKESYNKDFYSTPVFSVPTSFYSSRHEPTKARFHGEPISDLTKMTQNCVMSLSQHPDSVPAISEAAFAIDNSFTNTSCQVEKGHNEGKCKMTIELANKELWERFYEIGTEMIITKAGRRMFPSIKLNVKGLRSHCYYIMAIDILPVDNSRYRYVYQNSKWMTAGATDVCPPPCTYIHPDSPARGDTWMRQNITFDKLKLTNHEMNKKGHVILHSMHKYQPRIHVIECHGNHHASIHQIVPQNRRIDEYVRRDVTTVVFPECQFTTVTAYQNQQITQLKIDLNPFAKGFRDTNKQWRAKTSTEKPETPSHPDKHWSSNSTTAVRQHHPVFHDIPRETIIYSKPGDVSTEHFKSNCATNEPQEQSSFSELPSTHFPLLLNTSYFSLTDKNPSTNSLHVQQNQESNFSKKQQTSLFSSTEPATSYVHLNYLDSSENHGNISQLSAQDKRCPTGNGTFSPVLLNEYFRVDQDVTSAQNH